MGTDNEISRLYDEQQQQKQQQQQQRSSDAGYDSTSGIDLEGADSFGEILAASQPRQPDGIIRKYEEHEDSVYCVEWSSVDPWIFASLSYDGRLVINHVPNATKFGILL